MEEERLEKKEGRKKKQDPRKIEAEDLGSCVWQSNEDSDFGRLESDCAVDEWEMEDQQSKVQNDGAKDSRTWQEITEEETRSFFDGGVSTVCACKIKNRVGYDSNCGKFEEDTRRSGGQSLKLQRFYRKMQL